MMNIEDLIEWLICSQDKSDEKVREFCGDMGCHGMRSRKRYKNIADCTSCKRYNEDSPECDNCGDFLDKWEWRGIANGTS